MGDVVKYIKNPVTGVVFVWTELLATRVNPVMVPCTLEGDLVVDIETENLRSDGLIESEDQLTEGRFEEEKAVEAKDEQDAKVAASKKKATGKKK